MRTLLALYFMITQATAQVAPPSFFPPPPNYLLPSMQPTAPWGPNYNFGSVRPPIYGVGLPAAYVPQAPMNYFGGGMAQPSPFGLGGPRFPMPYPPMLPQQQNGFGSLLALGLPLFAQMFGGGLTSGTPTPAGPEDCEVCRGLRASAVPRRFGPPPTPPEDLPARTEAVAPVPIAASVPAYRPAVLPRQTDRIATVEETPSVTPAARPVVQATAATTTVNGPRSAPRSPAIVTTRERATPAELMVVRARTRDERRSQTAPVWDTFLHNFQVCAPGCTPADYGTYGSRNNNSCHPSGRAIDVHKMVCGGRVYTAIENGPQFRRMVACMESAPGNHNKSQPAIASVRGLQPMRTLFHNKDPRRYGITEAHYDHVHFSITCFNGRVW